LTEDPGRLRRSDRRRSHMEGPADEDPEERRRRREERRARRVSETPKMSRRTSAPVVDSYFDPRNGTKSRGTEPDFLPADGPVYKDSSRRKKAWPHSGTDSWVQETSDAPPPPEDAPNVDTAADDNLADENERRHLRKTRRRTTTEEDPEERRRRRESRRQSRQDRDTMKSSEGSQENGRRSSRRDSGFVESRAPSAQGGLFSRWKNLI